MNDIASRVKSMVAEQLHIAPDTITDDATLEKLGADSLDIVELIMRFEDEFDVEIHDEDAEKLHTVRDVVTYLDNLTKKTHEK
jgi:acyl carrier protein